LKFKPLWVCMPYPIKQFVQFKHCNDFIIYHIATLYIICIYILCYMLYYNSRHSRYIYSKAYGEFYLRNVLFILYNYMTYAPIRKRFKIIFLFLIIFPLNMITEEQVNKNGFDWHWHRLEHCCPSTTTAAAISHM